MTTNTTEYDRTVTRNGDELTVGRIGTSREWGVWSVYASQWLCRVATRREARAYLARAR